MDNENNYRIISTGKISLEAVDPSADLNLSGKQIRIIDDIWASEYERSGGRLFNGSVFVYSSHEITKSGVSIKGFFSEYKLFLAGIKRPDLGYRLIPVGVSGIVICRENDGAYALFAKRAETTSMYQGYYELVPAGTIDQNALHTDKTIDYKAKLLEELEEEIGGDFRKDSIESIEDLAFVLDVKENVYDVCCVITIIGQMENIERNMRSSDEYCCAEFVPVDKLAGFVAENSDRMIPTSPAIIEAFKKRS